jgi:hypothetical protein
MTYEENMKDRERWIAEGRKRGAKYVIVSADTFSYENYPVYAFSDEEKDKKVREHSTANMSRVMETIKL